MLGKQQSFYIFRLLSDLLLLNLVFIAAAIFAQPVEVLSAKPFMFILLILLNGAWYLASNNLNYYEDFHSKDAVFHIIQISKLVIFCSLIVLLFIFFTKEDLYTRNFVIFFTVIFPVSLFLRFLINNRILNSLRKKDKYTRNLVIIGSGKVGQEFRQTVTSNPSLIYNFIGFVDDNPSEANRENHLGSISGLAGIIKEKDVHEVIIALPNNAGEETDNVVRICNIAGVRTHIIPDMFRFLSKKYRISMIADFPIITVRNEPLESLHWQFIKRLFDVTVSLIALLLICSWLFPLVILLQKILSPGPVLFIQKRVGKEHRLFSCYKFRTMVTANHDKVFVATQIGDSRITKFGAFLRKSNIDELPQLFNVLRGDMSIVGPRPHAVTYDEQYREYIEDLRLRNLVKPGITGWAQVHGLRGDVPDLEENKLRIRKRFEYDLWYVENWTLTLDLQIIFMTIWNIVQGKVKGQ